MDRRRALTAVAVVAAAGALAAVTIPALAGTGHEPIPAPDPVPAAAEPAPELLAALRRDLGLTDAQARRRLTREAWAAETVAALREDIGDRWAGAWLGEGADRLTVAVTDRAAAAKVRAAGAVPAIVRHSASRLDGSKARLDRAAARAGGGIAGWYVDVASNSVTILAPARDEAAAWAFARASRVPADAVRVATSDESPRLLFDVQGGDPYFINGAARCSVGFSVEGGFVTAGHCALAGTVTTGFNNAPQGEFVAASFPGVGAGGPDDWGVVAVNADWTPRPVVNDFAGGLLPVAGSAEAPVGASICKYGSTTGVSCGVVQAKNATVRYPEGTVTGLTRTTVCAEPGDSGGSWLSGDQAQGVTSGGSGDCTSGGVTFFQPVNEILQANDLTLVTTAGSGGGDPPEAPPTTSPPAALPPPPPPAGAGCGDGEPLRGRLSASEPVQVQPDGRFYRATSTGVHTVCLDGPGGADFDLVLQRWTGQDWHSLASATGPTADEVVAVDGPAGFYRVGVIRDSGSGRYALRIAAP